MYYNSVLKYTLRCLKSLTLQSVHERVILRAWNTISSITGSDDVTEQFVDKQFVNYTIEELLYRITTCSRFVT